MPDQIRQVQVIYGYMLERLSRKQSERFILAHAAGEGLSVPQPPIARFWCRRAPAGAPAEYMIGWTGPVAVTEQDKDAAWQLKQIITPDQTRTHATLDQIALGDEKTIVTHDMTARGVLVS